MGRSFKIFAWDFHGTLERGVEVGFWQILKILAKEHKIAEDFKLEDVRKLYGTSVAEYLRHFFPKSSDQVIARMMKLTAQVQNQDHLKSYVKVAPGAREILSKIKRAGHKNIVLSNSHPNHIHPLIKIVGLVDLIEEVYAIDRHYTNKKIDPVKEKAKILKKIVKLNKLKKGELIAIGDRATDVNAGLAAGAVTYQYIRPGFPVDETKAHFKISDLREVLAQI